LEKQSQAQQHELKKAQKIVQLSEELHRELEETREANKERIEAFAKKCRDKLQNEKRGKPKGKAKCLQYNFVQPPLPKKRRKNVDSDSDYEESHHKKKNKRASGESDVVAEPIADNASLESTVPEATPLCNKGNNDEENHDNKGNDGDNVEGDGDHEEDEEPLPGIKIMGHLMDKDKKLWIKCKFDGEKKVELLESHSIWADYPADLLQYIQKKKLRGAKWKLPTMEDALEIRQVLDHEADDKGDHTCYLVIWDNGFKGWEDAKLIISDAPNVVDTCLEELKFEVEAT